MAFPGLSASSLDSHEASTLSLQPSPGFQLTGRSLRASQSLHALSAWVKQLPASDCILCSGEGVSPLKARGGDGLYPDPTKLNGSCPPAKGRRKRSQALISLQQQGIFPCDGGRTGWEQGGETC